MADTTPEIPRLPGEADPTSLAAAQLAAGIHQDFLSELRSAEPVDFEQRLAGHAEQYPRILFGAVATHIAGVELPTDATVADRTQAVVEALRRIISTPRLFEAVTGASFQESAALQHQLDITTSKDEAEVTAAKELRAAIAECGFLDQSMIPGDVQFNFSMPARRKLNAGDSATICLRSRRRLYSKSYRLQIVCGRCKRMATGIRKTATLSRWGNARCP